MINKILVHPGIDRIRLLILEHRLINPIGLIKQVHIATDKELEFVVLRFGIDADCLGYGLVGLLDEVLLAALSIDEQSEQGRGQVVVVGAGGKRGPPSQLLVAVDGGGEVQAEEVVFGTHSKQALLELVGLVLLYSL